MCIDSAVDVPKQGATVLRSAPGGESVERFLRHYAEFPRRPWFARAFGVNPLTRRSARWFWSAVGALELVSELEALAPEFRIVHGIPGAPIAGGGVGNKNGTDAVARGIEHVVIGPPGVFAISAHNHYREKVWVSGRNFVVEGHQLPYVRHAENDLGYVERMLGVGSGAEITATALIVLIAPAAVSVGELPRDVFVVSSGAVSSWFAGRERVLDAGQVGAIAAAAESVDTWTARGANTGHANGDGAILAVSDLSQRTLFEAVRREVAAARIIRSAWAVALVLGTIGALMAVSILQLVG